MEQIQASLATLKDVQNLSKDELNKAIDELLDLYEQHNEEDLFRLAGEYADVWNKRYSKNVQN